MSIGPFATSFFVPPFVSGIAVTALTQDRMMHFRVEERPTVRKALTVASKTDFMDAFHDAAGNFLA